MTFAEAIPELKKRKKIRCTWWDANAYIMFDHLNYEILSWFFTRADGTTRVEVYEFTDEDFGHDGWEALP